MKRLDELFIVHRARSGLFEEYEAGAVPYISNTSDANGVTGFVEPLDGDTVFSFTGIVLNSFSRLPASLGARVQPPPFIACSRSGNGLIVLEPRAVMSLSELAAVAAFINRAHGWRFTWYRQATKDRVCGLHIPERLPTSKFGVTHLLPEGASKPFTTKLHFKLIRLDAMFDLAAGNYHSESALDPGPVPLVSCGDENNGVVGRYSVPDEDVHSRTLTIAFNGRPLTAKYHPYAFAAKDDVAIATPLRPLRITTLLFVQMMLNRERWRYSYYRKCYMEKLRRFEVPLPHSGSALDEDAMQAVIESAAYWPYMKRRLSA